jgi:hypothetical protein
MNYPIEVKIIHGAFANPVDRARGPARQDHSAAAVVPARTANSPGSLGGSRSPGSTLLPGLIDAHVHLVADSGPGALDRLSEFAEDDLVRTIEESLRIQLATGVTTVRDLGDKGWSVLDWPAPLSPGCRRWWPPGRRSPAAAGIAGTWAPKHLVGTNCGPLSGNGWNAAPTS